MWIMPLANLPQRCDNMEPLGRVNEEQKADMVGVEGVFLFFCLREIWLWFKIKIQKRGE